MEKEEIQKLSNKALTEALKKDHEKRFSLINQISLSELRESVCIYVLAKNQQYATLLLDETIDRIKKMGEALILASKMQPVLNEMEEKINELENEIKRISNEMKVEITVLEND